MFVVGNGMIANAFLSSDYELSNCIIFASGVSNSKCSDISEFEKEWEIIAKAVEEQQATFIDSELGDLQKEKVNMLVDKVVQLNLFEMRYF